MIDRDNLLEIKITVFTPTYNRGYIINNLYNSLLKQKVKCFEWVIVDDGSTDNTKDLIENYINEKRINITYIKQSNGGKHRAINKGVEISKGELFFIVDSDDYLIEDALEKIIEWEKTLPKNNKKKFAGISGMRKYSNGEIIGGQKNFKYIDATNLERDKYGLFGDKAEIYFTSILRKHPFPEFPKENFLTEALIWNKIAHEGFKIRWFNEAIYVCEYLTDGLSLNLENKITKNWNGYKTFLQNMIQWDSSYKKKIRIYIPNYIKFGLKSGIKDSEIKKELLEISNVNFLDFYLAKFLDKIIISLRGANNHEKK